MFLRIHARRMAILSVVAMGAGFMTVSNNAAGHVFTASFVLGFIAFQLVANGLATRTRGLPSAPAKAVAVGRVAQAAPPGQPAAPVEAVIAGFYDAAVVRERRFREVAAEQDLVALARFEDSGELLVARPNLPAQTAAGFQRALLRLTHAVSEGSFFDAPARFKAATEEDYKRIEERLSAEAAFEE